MRSFAALRITLRRAALALGHFDAHCLGDRRASPAPRSTSWPPLAASTAPASMRRSATRSSSTSPRCVSTRQEHRRPRGDPGRAGHHRAATGQGLHGRDRSLHRAAAQAGLHDRRHRRRRIADPSADRGRHQRAAGGDREEPGTRFRRERPAQETLAGEPRGMAGAILYAIAIRARLGSKAADLRAFAASMVPTICG
jgi:hypothetical protein